MGMSELAMSTIRRLGVEQHRLQQAVLGLLVQAFPEQLTLNEVIRELAAEPKDFGERDAIGNAARDLVGAGLLHRHDAFYFPTRACLRAHELLNEPADSTNHAFPRADPNRGAFILARTLAWQSAC